MVAKTALILSLLLLTLMPASASAQNNATLPVAGDHPLRIDFSTDPILQFASQQADAATFRRLVARVVVTSPASQGADAQFDQAEAVAREARARLGPTVDTTLQSYRVISRDFGSNGVDNFVERTRPEQRTDVMVQIQQPLLDFGSGIARLGGARSRQRAAAADGERVRSEVALQFISLWYQVAGNEALLGVIDAFIDREAEVRRATQDRIDIGAAASVEMVQVDALFAETKARRAQASRGLAAARARYEAFAGEAAPSDLRRPPVPVAPPPTGEEMQAAALNSAPVRTAEALARAAHSDAYAARADTLPTASVGLEAGRYGVVERTRDYDIRALFTVRARLFGGGGDARVDQARARARAADAQVEQARLDATSEAAIARADIDALQQQLVALDASYRAARISRDAVVTRFLSTRGSVIDVARTEDAFVNAALSYMRGLGELDIARYSLLARAGVLLDVLEIGDAAPGDDGAR